ncbi:MAG: hypothetical protein JSV69_02840 [Chloroflexota bacterium]|nr:MAG: hypothetical protein JSV69_02840 [Chloroflexota bacterium]
MSTNIEQIPENQRPLYPGFEYRSEQEIFGWPLIHITRGHDAFTGKRLVSKGLIAIGEISIGLVAIGGFAFGGIAMGGMGVGLIAFGGLAIGLIALGGVALGMVAAMGAAAYSFIYAIGVMAHAQYVISPFRLDWEVFGHLRQLWSEIQHIL